MTQKSVRVDDGQMAELQKYSEKSGVPVAQAVREALGNFIQTTMHARLIALGDPKAVAKWNKAAKATNARWHRLNPGKKLAGCTCRRCSK